MDVHPVTTAHLKLTQVFLKTSQLKRTHGLL